MQGKGKIRSEVLYETWHGIGSFHNIQKRLTLTETKDKMLHNMKGTGGAYYVPYSFLLISNMFCYGEKWPKQGD
jgi:hypothetical protein